MDVFLGGAGPYRSPHTLWCTFLTQSEHTLLKWSEFWPYLIYLHMLVSWPPHFLLAKKKQHRHQKKCIENLLSNTHKLQLKIAKVAEPLDASVLQVASSAGVPPPPPLGRRAAARGQPRWLGGWTNPNGKKNILGFFSKNRVKKELKMFETNRWS